MDGIKHLSLALTVLILYFDFRIGFLNTVCSSFTVSQTPRWQLSKISLRQDRAPFLGFNASESFPNQLTPSDPSPFSNFVLFVEELQEVWMTKTRMATIATSQCLGAITIGRSAL